MVILLGLFPALTLSCNSGGSDSSHTNVVIIIADDLGYGDVSGYGAQLIQTPNIDRLIREGRRFLDAHSSSAVCTPTRYSLMTGRYSWRGMLKSGVAGVSAPLLIENGQSTLASFLQDQGYTTACIGKWHLGFGPEHPTDWNAPLIPGPLETGFDYFYGVPNGHAVPPFVYVEDYKVVDRQPGELIEIVDGIEVSGLANFRRHEEVGRRITDKAVEFIEDNRDDPFFLYFATSSIHLPITPDAEFVGTSDLGIYGDFTAELDWSVGRILDALEANNLAENTLVIFTSDNGALSYLTCDTPHRSNGPWRGAKGRIEEGGHRVPFVARWPGVIEPETESDALVSLVDLYATVASALGLDVPAGAAPDSTSRWYGFVDDPVHFPRPESETTILHSWRGKFALRLNNWKYVPAQLPRDFTFEFRDAPPIPRGLDCVIDWDPLDTDVTPEQLYDLNADPQETTNLAGVEPDVRTVLATLLDATIAPEVINTP